jgi:hypothetical protein
MQIYTNKRSPGGIGDYSRLKRLMQKVKIAVGVKVQEPNGHSLRKKLRTRSVSEAVLTGGGDAGGGVVGGGGEATAAFTGATSPSTLPWKMSVGRTRTRRISMIILGSISGWTLELALNINGGTKTW